MANSITLLTLLSMGLLAFRPKRVPSIARNTGRLFGLSLRAIKKARDVADETIQRNTANSAMTSSPAFKAVRSTVESSLSQLSSISTSVQREMSDTPLSPAAFIRSRFRRITQQQKMDTVKPTVVKSETTQPPQQYQSSVSSPHLESLQPKSSVTNNTEGVPPPPSIGVDFIAQGIEEDALKRKKDNMFGVAEAPTERTSSS